MSANTGGELRVSNVGVSAARGASAKRRPDCVALRRAVEDACGVVWDENRGDVKKVMIKRIMGAGDPVSVSTSWVSVCESFASREVAQSVQRPCGAACFTRRRGKLRARVKTAMNRVIY